LHFPSTQAGLRILQDYLDAFSSDPGEFFGLCEPTGGYYGATVFQYLLDHDYDMNLVENAMTREIRERIFPGLPKTDEMETRVMTRIGYLHEAVGEEFTLRPLELPKQEDADLLALCRDSWKLSAMITRARNQFTQLMAVTFPELKTFFTSSVSTVVPVSLMAAYPTPALLAEAPAEKVREVLWEASGYQHTKRVAELQDLARNSSGLLPNPGRVWRQEWLTDFPWPGQAADQLSAPESARQTDRGAGRAAGRLSVDCQCALCWSSRVSRDPGCDRRCGPLFQLSQVCGLYWLLPRLGNVADYRSDQDVTPG
jgi:hypothetical protein